MTLASTSVEPHPYKGTIAIIGNGPVGVHFCNELLALSDAYEIHIYGDEPYDPYNRVALSQLLYGEKSLSDLRLTLTESPQLHTHWHTRITRINTERRCITDNQGIVRFYDRLILATGSRAHIPNIPGTGLNGVFSFRNMQDAAALLSRRVASRHTVVLGGGLLGIETARAMRRLSTDVTLIHHSAWLMNRQLDEASATALTDTLAAIGIRVKLNTAVMAVDGARRVEGLILRDGTTLPCDTLIIATGIQPNIELARDAGIPVGRGIRVSAGLETGAKGVYAIGECTEINGEVYGLVAPGLEQAALLARRLTGHSQDEYQQRALSTRLKVLDTPVISTGEIGQVHTGPDSHHLIYRRDGITRSLHFERGRLLGAAGIGHWPDQERIKDLLEDGGDLNPLQRLRFRFTGRIWDDDEQILDHHIICNCRQVSAGSLRACASAGKPLATTGAGTVCGSCTPLLAEFTPVNAHPGESLTTSASVAPGMGWQLATGLIAMLLISLFIFTGPLIPIPQQYTPGHISEWWTDSFKRQISGFTLLVLTTLSLMLSGRKRLAFWKWLPFSFWRGLHIVLTTLVLGLLFLHTGQSDYQGLNRWLITTFWTVAVLGFVTSLLSYREQTSPSVSSKRHKRWAVMAHLLAFWPLPALLTFHVLKVYWF